MAMLGLLMTMIVLAGDPADPYLWLEEVAGDKPLAWVRQRNEQSVAALAKSPGFEASQGRILKILDSTDRIPQISKAGEWYYNFWRDGKNPRGLWRRTTLAEYRKPAPNWETVLDLDALGAAEKENWVWHGASFLRPEYRRCLVSLSRGGADAAVTREFDVTTKSFVKDGFVLPEAKAESGWRGIDSLFVATDFGPGSLTDSGYPRVAKEWTHGTPLAEAKLVFEGRKSDIAVSAVRSLTPGYERDFVSRAITFYTSEMFLRRDGKLIKIEVPEDANPSVVREHLFVELRSAWAVGGKTFPAGSLLVTDFEGFLAGKRDLRAIFTPTERTSLAGFTPTKNGAILNVLDNVSNKLYRVRAEDAWKPEPLPGVPLLSSVSAAAVEADKSDDYFLFVSNFLTPASLLMGSLGGPPPETLKRNPAFFDTAGLEVTQHFATSKDGTRVPYFQVSKAGVALDGTAPTLLYGYGGFEVSLTPDYSAVVGSEWLARGGVYALANIRGGGEFGPKWHQAALKANRHRAYEDFAAVADDLVRRKVTSVDHLGAMGGSNGGLLMGNMLTLYPDRFGAIVCQVPLLDMRRYHKLLAGASWMAEYGDPDDAKQWESIKTFSPYQNVRKDAKYPPVLFTTSTRDDRVHPGHARKTVARLLELGHDVLFYENIEGGHGGAADHKQAAFMEALAFEFLWKRLR